MFMLVGLLFSIGVGRLSVTAPPNQWQLGGVAQGRGDACEEEKQGHQPPSHPHLFLFDPSPRQVSRLEIDLKFERSALSQAEKKLAVALEQPQKRPIGRMRETAMRSLVKVGDTHPPPLSFFFSR